MDRVDHEWKIWWYPDDTTAQGCAMMRVPQEIEVQAMLFEANLILSEAYLQSSDEKG